MFRDLFNVKSLGPIVGLFIVLLVLPPIIPRFYTYILAVILVTALVAMSLNMVVGHGHRRFLCQADAAVLWNAPDLIRFFDLGDCFSLVQSYRRR